MTKGLASDAPGLACLDSGKVSFSMGSTFLKVVVTIKKISTTNSTSMSETIMTEGARRRWRAEVKCMGGFQRAGGTSASPSLRASRPSGERGGAAKGESAPADAGETPAPRGGWSVIGVALSFLGGRVGWTPE